MTDLLTCDFWFTCQFASISLAALLKPEVLVHTTFANICHDRFWPWSTCSSFCAESNWKRLGLVNTTRQVWPQACMKLSTKLDSTWATSIRWVMGVDFLKRAASMLLPQQIISRWACWTWESFSLNQPQIGVCRGSRTCQLCRYVHSATYCTYALGLLNKKITCNITKKAGPDKAQ